ncbi:MAG: Unknown protein [uncultured Sulfurovum sp.]|uniref:Methyltransferase domain-containing protein n=1 Tax=uncultured Sulfurovum sp. TaxID=269237 RepID=A0A6S6T4E1_9BACT|nr:MAG: Unknown protein [uncultured Sulfurovum sp.]
MSNALDLYAKVEDLLGVREVIPVLNEYYHETLETLEFKTLLDVGCGSGTFLEELSQVNPDVQTLGIDLSPIMVEMTKAKGLKAQCIDLCNLEGKFDVITAIFDMVNYLDKKSLKHFFGCVEEHLEEDGHFLLDINTFFAFTVVAAGSFIRDVDDRFLTIDSDYDESVAEYYAEFTLFEKIDETYVKSQESITQYYYEVSELEKLTKMKLLSKKAISIYSDEAEKFYLVFKK